MSAPRLRCHSACGVAKTRCVVVATTIRTSPSLHSNIPRTAGHAAFTGLQHALHHSSQHRAGVQEIRVWAVPPPPSRATWHVQQQADRQAFIHAGRPWRVPRLLALYSQGR